MLEDNKYSLEDFLEKNSEICNIVDSHAKIRKVDDIYSEVYNDDHKYAVQQLKWRPNLYGLFYETAQGNLVILLKNTDDENVILTLWHELVHFSDYLYLKEKEPNKTYRQLQENFYFLCWTEFHATYLSYKYLIENIKSCINPLECAEKEKKNLVEYYNSSKKLDINNAMDRTVRSYGFYIALQNYFPDELDKYFSGYYLNK